MLALVATWLLTLLVAGAGALVRVVVLSLLLLLGLGLVLTLGVVLTTICTVLLPVAALGALAPLLWLPAVAAPETGLELELEPKTGLLAVVAAVPARLPESPVPLVVLPAASCVLPLLASPVVAVLVVL